MTLTEKHNNSGKIKDPAFLSMQDAVAAALKSKHPTNPIGATLEFSDGTRLSSSNLYIDALGPIDQKFGGAGPTIHAEMATILNAIKEGKITLGAKIYITDPPCPSCMKILVEAGISEIFVDNKGFEKDWYKKRGQDFREMSLSLAGQAGIPIHRLKRNKDKMTAETGLLNKNLLNECPQKLPYSAVEFKQIIEGHTAYIPDLIKKAKAHFGEDKRIAAMVGQPINSTFSGAPMFIAYVQSNAVSMHMDGNALTYKSEKYTFEMLAMDRLIASSARHGLMPISPLILSNYETGSELIDLAGLARITRDGKMLEISFLERTEHNPDLYGVMYSLSEASLVQETNVPQEIIVNQKELDMYEVFSSEIT